MRISDWSSDVCSSDLSVPSACSSHQITYIGKTARHRRRRRHGGRQQMRPRPRPLPADEIAVGGRGAALLRRHLVGVHREAHRAARLAPFKARFNEDTVQPFLFRSEEHTSELQSLMRISYAFFCLKKKTQSL